MKLDSGIHIAMHSVLSLKPGVTATVGSGRPTTTSTTEKAQQRLSLSLSLPPDPTTGAHEHALATGKEAAELRAVLASNCPNQT